MNERKIERVAKAICWAAGASVPGDHCTHCECPEFPEPCIWQSFKNEAVAAIKAMKGF
jgi:hypothetical protein